MDEYKDKLILHCNECGHYWKRKPFWTHPDQLPKLCPKCQSNDWKGEVSTTKYFVDYYAETIARQRMNGVMKKLKNMYQFELIEIDENLVMSMLIQSLTINLTKEIKEVLNACGRFSKIEGRFVRDGRCVPFIPEGDNIGTK